MSKDEMSLDDLLNFDGPSKTEDAAPEAAPEEVVEAAPVPVAKKAAPRKTPAAKAAPAPVVEEVVAAPVAPPVQALPANVAPSEIPGAVTFGASDPEDAEIARLRAELAAPKVQTLTGANGRLRQDLTPKEQEIVRLRDELAQRQAAEFEKSELALEEANENAIVIHVKLDGFSAQGKIWYRGEEMRFDPEGAAYEQTKDRFGNSWVDIAGDERAQFKLWKNVYLGVGPWPGFDWDDPAAAEAARRRNGAVPVL